MGAPVDQTSSTTTGDNLLMTYFQRRLMSTLHAEVRLYQLADKYPLPQGSGTSMVFNGWRTLGQASSTLSEFAASANSTVVLSSRKITATIASYGRAVKVTELLELTSIAPPVDGAVRELEQSAALTVDAICQLAVFKNAIAQTGQTAKATLLSTYVNSRMSAFCANTGTCNDSNKQFGLPAVWGQTSVTRLSMISKTAPSISARFGPIAVRRGVDRLRNFDAKPFADGYYYGVVHPKAVSTGLGNPDFKQWVINYEAGPKQTMFKGELGYSIHGVKFLMSTNIPRYATSAFSINLTPILGAGCLAVTELGGGVEMIIKRPGAQSTNDPFNLCSTIAYKVRGAAATLNASAGCIVVTFEKV